MITKFIAWVKTWSWVHTLLTVLAGIAFALAGVRASRESRRASRAEQQSELLLNDRTKRNVDRAEALQEAAQRHAAKAADARIAAEQRLIQLGDEDETLDDIADRFNSRRNRVRNNPSN